MTAPVLEIQGLTVRYGARLATWAVDLALGAGEVLGLVGESGAGKSTVGRAVVRLLPEPGRVETGALRLGGRDLLALTEPEMRRLRGADVALIPQDPLSALNPAFRIGLQATDALRIHRGLSARRRPAPRWSGSSATSASPSPRTCSGAIPTSCRGGCGSVSSSRWRSPASPRSSSPTSRRRRSTSRRRPRSCGSSRSSRRSTASRRSSSLTISAWSRTWRTASP